MFRIAQFRRMDNELMSFSEVFGSVSHYQHLQSIHPVLVHINLSLVFGVQSSVFSVQPRLRRRPLF